MQKNLLQDAEKMTKRNHWRRIWHKIVGGLACVVVFVTTYALILPAITQERETFCGLEAHVHTEECYEQTSAVKTLVCTYESLGIHAHTDACYDADGSLICEEVDCVAHTHNDDCYDSDGSLICQLPEVEQHVHTDDCYAPAETEAPVLHEHSEKCYDQEQGELICGEEEREGHSHDESCYENEELVCEIEEDPGHTHNDDCYEWIDVLVCGLEEGEEEPVPEKDPVLVCTEPELDVHVHDESCFMVTADDTLTCTEDHSHSEQCYGVWEAVCGMEEHEHTLSCYSDPDADVETAEDWEASFADVELTGEWHSDVVLIAESQLGYHESTANYAVWEDESIHGYTRYGEWYGIPYGDWCGMFASFCLHYAGVEGMPYDNGCRTWIETLSKEEYDLYRPAAEHTPQPGELVFFDWEGDGLSDHVGIVAEIIEATETEPAKLKTIEGNSSNCVQYVEYALSSEEILGYAELPEQMAEEDRAKLQMVIDLIDVMPSADEIDAKMAEFEDAEDYEGEEAWLTEVYQQVARAYYYYSALSDELKAKVTNADKLLELEYIWSVTTYDYTDSTPVFQINTYTQANKNVLLYGDAVSSVITGTTFTNDWYAYIIKWNSAGYWYLDDYIYRWSSKNGIDPGTNGFVLLLYKTYGYLDSIDELNDGSTVYVTLNFDFTEESGYKAAGFGNVTFGTSEDEAIIKKTSVESDAPTVVKSADTSKFIELNLYNYSSKVNEKYSNNTFTYTSLANTTYTTSVYPGFQWNGGAYVYSTDSTGYAKRTVIDNIDFGNSLITDYSYTGTIPDKSDSAFVVAKFADQYRTGTDDAYNINSLDFYEFSDESSNGYGVNNRPIGLSLNANVSDLDTTLIKRTLGRDKNGNAYPILTTDARGEVSLAYLFQDGTYADKQNTTSINGLFQYEEKTGGYWYNSRWNHAQYSNNTFTLYDEIITPNLITYPFGNFLPFNDITDSESATQVSKITSMGDYIQYFMNQLWSYYNAEKWGTNVSVETDMSKAQLYHMLDQYKQNISNSSIHSKTWSTFSANDAIWDYLTGSGKSTGTSGAGDNPTDTFPITDSYLEELYNIDYDVEKDFFFGMDMSMEFYMPKDGMVGKDLGDNNNDLDSDHNRGGEPDGIPDQPMIFSFTGDDDVWVYVDDVLFLDLSGIHRHVGGRINYTEGKVYYYALDISTGDINTDKPYATYTFKQILEAAGKNPDDYLNDKGTFVDYSTHTFKFYYMERGSGSSICSINFNFPLVEHNSITIEKELTDDSTSIEALGNPDFAFRVLRAGTKDELFLDGNWAYSLYDTDGSVIQEIEVSDSYPDGRVEEMTIKDAAGNVLCKETYDANGNRLTQTGDGLDKVLRIGDDGVFTLKAGQKAVFVGISQHAGEYYVQELLHDDLKEQYGSITITGSASRVLDNIANGLTTVGEFVGADSPDQYASNSHVFHYENKINTDNLGALSITKIVSAYTEQDANKEYEFNVTLDGELLPVGTSYGTDKTVETAGVIKLKAGETATISNIIAGTEFVVTETSESSEGFLVNYKVDGKTQGDSGATGTIGVATTVELEVTNSEKGAIVYFPVTKRYHVPGATDRKTSFNLIQVTDATGRTTVGTAESESITVAKEPVTKDQLFSKTYLRDTVPFGDADTVKFYYRLTEDNSKLPGYTAENYEVYVYEVTVTKTEDDITAAITGMWYGTADTNGVPTGELTKLDGITTASFTNTITRNLIITKTVSGASDTTTEFEFTLELSQGKSNAPVPTTLIGYLNGSTEGAVYTGVDGVFTFKLKNGDELKLTGIPYKCAMTLTETDTKGYIPSCSAYKSANGTWTLLTDGVYSYYYTCEVLSSSTTKVEFTNTYAYELPQTGGAGTHMYTMAGLLLMLIGTAFLLYKVKKRGREVI